MQGGEAVMYRGMLDCFARTVREEGVKALFKVRGGMRWAGRGHQGGVERGAHNAL